MQRNMQQEVEVTVQIMRVKTRIPDTGWYAIILGPDGLIEMRLKNQDPFGDPRTEKVRTIETSMTALSLLVLNEAFEWDRAAGENVADHSDLFHVLVRTQVFLAFLKETEKELRTEYGTLKNSNDFAAKQRLSKKIQDINRKIEDAKKIINDDFSILLLSNRISVTLAKKLDVTTEDTSSALLNAFQVIGRSLYQEKNCPMRPIAISTAAQAEAITKRMTLNAPSAVYSRLTLNPDDSTDQGRTLSSPPNLARAGRAAKYGKVPNRENGIKIRRSEFVDFGVTTSEIQARPTPGPEVPPPRPSVMQPLPKINPLPPAPTLPPEILKPPPDEYGLAYLAIILVIFVMIGVFVLFVLTGIMTP